MPVPDTEIVDERDRRADQRPVVDPRLECFQAGEPHGYEQGRGPGAEHRTEPLVRLAQRGRQRSEMPFDEPRDDACIFESARGQ